MPEVIFNGPPGRLEGRYQPSKEKNAPIALILHPHPQFGGTMNNKIVYDLFYMFQQRGFTTLRFNFRGIGRSQGEFDHGAGELSDAASALDWVQALHPDSKTCWVAGYSFGSWIGMQLLMRRPEIEGFISVSRSPRRRFRARTTSSPVRAMSSSRIAQSIWIAALQANWSKRVRSACVKLTRNSAVVFQIFSVSSGGSPAGFFMRCYHRDPMIRFLKSIS